MTTITGIIIGILAVLSLTFLFIVLIATSSIALVIAFSELKHQWKLEKKRKD